ncbi:MAG: hypothetical protein ABIH09_02195 [Candidatus Omnitrophota bacterium]
MKTQKHAKIFSKLLQGKKGVVLATVLGFLALMIMTMLPLASMIQRDVRLVQRVREKEQARFMAEAGINHALAKMRTDGFDARANFTGTLDTGSYNVTFSEVGARHVINSVGTVSGISETVLAEISDNTPTALNYLTGAGNDIMINSLVSNAMVSGDIHANNNVYLKASPWFSFLTVNGDVSATGIVKEGQKYNSGNMDKWDDNVAINGAANDTAMVYENQDRITFPTFEYMNTVYKQAAQDSGDYYSSNVTFNSATLSPTNGIIYVDGNVNFLGNCILNGGIIAEDILVAGSLYQFKSGDKNVILAKDGDIKISGVFSVNEALVFAAQDIKSIVAQAVLNVNGIILAGRNIDMWNVLTTIQYTYVAVSPSDLMGEDGTDTFSLVSWNR